MRRSLAIVALLALPAAGCTTTNLGSAEVALPMRLSDACLESTLRAEPEVVGFRSLPQGDARGWYFELADPDLVYKQMPSFVVSQRATGATLVLEIEANFLTSGRNGPALRQGILKREQEILSRVVQSCADSMVEFGTPHECGKGEKDSLCVKGRLPSP